MFKQDQEIFDILKEVISEGVVIVDSQQKIVEVNKSVEQLFDYDRSDLIDQPLNTLIPTKHRVKHSGHFKQFMKAKESRQMGLGRDLYGQRKDGSVFPVEVGLNPFKVDGATFVMAIVIDITKAKNYTTNLENIVEQRTQQLKEALDKEKDLNELKTKFLSLVSHEFKTPLSGILTSATLLQKYTTEAQQTKREKHIRTITDKVYYLNNILNDFLSMERLEKGKVKYNNATFNVSKVVNEVVYGANLLLKEGQKINYPDDIDHISLYQDEKIIELALSNLVQNAIKYSSESNTIDIAIHQDSDFTVFKVSDQGIGIPKEDQKNIFNRYFRAENVLLTQGTGIGLNIVKHHLENLGGSISFTSRENKGSTFTFKIPNKATNEESTFN